MRYLVILSLLSLFTSRLFVEVVSIQLSLSSLPNNEQEPYFIQQQQQQQQRELVTLAEKWNITDNGFEYESLSFILGYVTSDFVLNSMIKAELYDTECMEGGVIIPSSELNYTIQTDDNDGSQPGLGDNPKNVSVKIDINSDVITDSVTYSEGTDNGELRATVQFCMRIGLFTNSEPPIEVNFLETIVILYIDLTDGFAIDTISVTPRDQLVQTANQAYQVEGYLCDYNNIELSEAKKGAARNQGSILRVCVRPDEEARKDEIYMRYIDTFTWQRDYEGSIGILTQPAVEDREAANNGLTDLECIPGSEVCAFETILFASMFRTPGAVTGAGIASMQFGTNSISTTTTTTTTTTTPKKRSLRHSSRFLQEEGDEEDQEEEEEDDVAAQAEFELDMEVVPVRNPYLNYDDSAASSILLQRFGFSCAMFVAIVCFL
jgi:hypothetical protein